MSLTSSKVALSPLNKCSPVLNINMRKEGISLHYAIQPRLFYAHNFSCYYNQVNIKGICYERQTIPM